eukprot:1136187-Pelagomonas_calceolata.AAC.1
MSRDQVFKGATLKHSSQGVLLVLLGQQQQQQHRWMYGSIHAQEVYQACIQAPSPFCTVKKSYEEEKGD